MTIPLSVRFDILERDHYTCRFCGRRAPETELEVDHVQPRSKGGSDAPANLVTACRDCNRGKGDRLVNLATTDWSSLVGKWFHSFDADGCVLRQGYVRSRIQEGIYLVVTFEWVTGSPFSDNLATIQQMVEEHWAWYQTGDEMREAHQYGYGGVRERSRETRNGTTPDPFAPATRVADDEF